MTHIESMESRRLCAAGPDPTFGKHGGVPLSSEDYNLDNVLATHGAVYVSAFDRNRRRQTVFKYSDAGVPDTDWGNGGYIVPKVYARPVADLFYAPRAIMGYDARTKGLIIGYGDFDRVILERRDARGAVDTAWGTQGHFSYREPKRFFTLDSVVPLAGKKVLVVARRQGLEGIFDQEIRSEEPVPGHLLQPIPGGEDDVILIRLDRLGRRDHAFSDGRTLTVAAGRLTDRDAVRDDPTGSVLSGHEFSDIPTFRDLQVREDGGVRVVTTRLTASTIISQVNVGTPSADRLESTRAVVSAESTFVSAAGDVVPQQSQSYVLKRYRKTFGGYSGHAAYEPVAAFATGDDGVAVLGNSPEGSPLLRLSPGRRSAATDLFTPSIEFEYAILSIDSARRGVNGDVLVLSNAGTGLRLTSDLTAQTDFDNGPISSIAALDDTGRVLSLYGDRVARFV